MRASIIASLLLPLALPAGCGSNTTASGPCDAGGCLCFGDQPDMDACLSVGPNYAPFCCTDHGGALVQCGQPPGCVPKPGVTDPGAMNANYCCPR